MELAPVHVQPANVVPRDGGDRLFHAIRHALEANPAEDDSARCPDLPAIVRAAGGFVGRSSPCGVHNKSNRDRFERVGLED